MTVCCSIYPRRGLCGKCSRRFAFYNEPITQGTASGEKVWKWAVGKILPTASNLNELAINFTIDKMSKWLHEWCNKVIVKNAIKSLVMEILFAKLFLIDGSEESRMLAMVSVAGALTLRRARRKLIESIFESQAPSSSFFRGLIKALKSRQGIWRSF